MNFDSTDYHDKLVNLKRILNLRRTQKVGRTGKTNNS
jgi:glutaredoxin-related protein